MRPSDPIVNIANQYQARFRGTLGPVRSIRREAEIPRVWPDGRGGDASLQWTPLLEQGGLEPIREGRRLPIGARGPKVINHAFLSIVDSSPAEVVRSSFHQREA